MHLEWLGLWGWLQANNDSHCFLGWKHNWMLSLGLHQWFVGYQKKETDNNLLFICIVLEENQQFCWHTWSTSLEDLPPSSFRTSTFFCLQDFLLVVPITQFLIFLSLLVRVLVASNLKFNTDKVWLKLVVVIHNRIQVTNFVKY